MFSANCSSVKDPVAANSSRKHHLSLPAVGESEVKRSGVILVIDKMKTSTQLITVVQL